MNEITFKVKFLGRKNIWLTLSLTDDKTLRKLNDAIQDGLGWMNDHLFEFIMSGKPYTHDCMAYQCESDDVDTSESGFLGFAERTPIRKVKLAPKQKFVYHFDFGDEHFFEITVLDIKPAKKSMRPKIIERSDKMPEQYA